MIKISFHFLKRSFIYQKLIQYFRKEWLQFSLIVLLNSSLRSNIQSLSNRNKNICHITELMVKKKLNSLFLRIQSFKLKMKAIRQELVLEIFRWYIIRNEQYFLRLLHLFSLKCILIYFFELIFYLSFYLNNC